MLMTLGSKLCVVGVAGASVVPSVEQGEEKEEGSRKQRRGEGTYSPVRFCACSAAPGLSLAIATT